MNDHTADQGEKTFEKITGVKATDLIENMKAVAPDMAHWLIQFAYGEVLSRPGLDLRMRQLATVAALTAMGTARTQLKLHIQGALNVGCTPGEIIEIILQMALYAGFPASLNALATARKVFEKNRIKP